MKNLNPKISWYIFLFISAVISLIIVIIFWISLIIGMIIFFPFLPYMPFVLNFLEREYEFECNILRVLRMAKFDNAIKEGWMAPLEILYAVEEISGRQSNIGAIWGTLLVLKKKNVVIDQIVPIEYLKNPPKRSRNHGFTLAFKLEDDSDYRPRKPKWLSEKQKKEKKQMHDGVVVHS